MKVGDTVTIRDYSYVCSISHGKVTYKRPNYCDDKGRQYTVVKTECSFPLISRHHLFQQPEYRNDTVIQADDGRAVFIHSRFLKLTDSPHVWVHGDVFTECDGSYPKVYIAVDNEEPQVFHLCGMKAYGKIHDYINADLVFLFNIKDKI